VTAPALAPEIAAGDARDQFALPALDSMRAVAAIAVLATHASFWGGAYAHAHARYGTALARLDIGVAIFFVLSGFLLSHSWLARHARGASAPSTGRYLWRRFLRIVPVYLLGATAALLLVPGNHDASPGLWIRTLTLTNIYVDDRLPDGFTQMWSLATEVAFYVLLPVIMWVSLSRRRDGRPSVSILGAVAVTLLALNVLWLLDLADRVQSLSPLARLWLPSYLTWFAVGFVLAACHVRVRQIAERDPQGLDSTDLVGRVAPGLHLLGRSPGVCWTAALALFAISATPLAGPSSLTAPSLGEALTKNLLYAATAGLLILPCVFAPPAGRFMRTMSLPVLRHVGHLSYGIFCVHLVVLELVARSLDMKLFEGRTFELFALTLAISLLVSEALYRVVERPAMRLKNLRGPGRGRSMDNRTPRAKATSS
jgi:peptidoglycan/LPS O-acetylase OafA/YrhL